MFGDGWVSAWLQAFLAGAFLAGAFLAGAFFAGAFLAGAFLAGAFFAGAFLAGAFFAGAFFAGAFLAGAFFAGAFLAGAFFAGAFLAGAFFAGAFFAGAFLAGAFFAGAFFAGAFFAGAFLAGAFFTTIRSLFPGLSDAFSVELAVNFIAVDAAIFTGAPVCGLRPVRALRLVVLNEPKPGHATFSPDFATDTTWSKNAPSVRSASAFETPAASATASISSALVAIGSSFGWAFRLGVVASRPARGAPRPSPTAGLPSRWVHVTDRDPSRSSIEQIAFATTNPAGPCGPWPHESVKPLKPSRNRAANASA